MINEALGFKAWVRLNEDADSQVEVYNEFILIRNSPDFFKLNVSSFTLAPKTDYVMEEALRVVLEKIFAKYLPGINLTNNNGNYTIAGDEYKNEDGESITLAFATDRSIQNEVKDKMRKMELFGSIKKQSIRQIKVSNTSAEYILKPEFNSIPEEEILGVLIERFEPEWIGEVTPENFSSDLESIQFSWSVGGSFFNDAELKKLMSDLLSLAVFEVYRDTLLTSIKTHKTIINIADLTSDLDSQWNAFKRKIEFNDVSEKDADSIIKFIKLLMFKLRPKGARIKEKADTVLAELMTMVDRAGLTKKLMDSL
jgi:hypothetical protein